MGGPAGPGRGSADVSVLLRIVVGGAAGIAGGHDCEWCFWAEEQVLFDPGVATTGGLLPSARISLSATLGAWTGITQGAGFPFSSAAGNT